MKTFKTILIVLLLICSIGANAQARLFKTKAEILADYPTETRTWSVDKDGDYVLSLKFEIATFFYYFKTATATNYICMAIPTTYGNVNAMVELYNKKYTIVSKTKWDAYLSGGIMTIQLLQEDEAYYFIYTSN